MDLAALCKAISNYLMQEAGPLQEGRLASAVWKACSARPISRAAAAPSCPSSAVSYSRSVSRAASACDTLKRCV